MSMFSEKVHDVSSWVAYSTSGGLVVFGVALNDLALIVGIVFAALTYFTNAWFKYQHLKLAQQATQDALQQVKAAVCDAANPEE